MFYEQREDIWNHRGHRGRLCVLKKSPYKSIDMGRWEMGSLVEHEGILEMKGLEPLPKT
jgi:hypothetical protein